MNSFLEKPNSLALQLNVDWFQPFDHLTYSVGAMYLTVLNLPSTERYKMKNVFLVGILPGPDEPKHDINSFLRPLVDDLLQLWEKGITVCLPDVGNVNIKCALCCLACDIPAARKVAGFIGHSGRLGCSKCRKEFLSMGSIGRLNYAGFDRNKWPKRSFRQHRDHVNEILLCTNKTEREKKESELGCRYSVLLDLPYFDPIRMTIIDPMHNLFLGTSKRFMSVLLDTGTISKDRLTFIQEVVKGMNVPDGAGRILWKIKSGFAGLTAEQWMNWTVIYSIVALKDLVTEETLECWRHFVLACRYLLKRNLTKTDIQIADALLIQFCSKFEALFGAERVTPNMHLHGHLKECLLDFGPLRSYWLFAFERYNGILENQPTNNANIEPQLMKKFFREAEVSKVTLHEDFSPNLLPLLPRVSTKDFTLKLTSKPVQENLDSMTLSNLLKFICLHENANSSCVEVSSTITKYSFLVIGGHKFGSELDRSQKKTIVLAQWKVHFYGEPLSEIAHFSRDISGDYYLRPFSVSYYMEVSYHVQSTPKTVLFAKGCWPKYSDDFGYFGKPYTVWCNERVESNSGALSFILVDQIVSNCAHCNTSVSDIGVLCVCPMIV